MPKNILIDLNVIVDVFLARPGFEPSRDVILLGEQGMCRLYVSAHMVTTLSYLLEDAKVPRPKILEHVTWLLDTFHVIPTDDKLLRAATTSSLSDYEDAVVEQSAIAIGAAIIITRNIRDFRRSVVPAKTSQQYLELKADSHQ